MLPPIGGYSPDNFRSGGDRSVQEEPASLLERPEAAQETNKSPTRPKLKHRTEQNTERNEGEEEGDI